MLFTSIDFAVFFLIVFVLYSLLRRKLQAQNILLLCASYVFYGYWDIRFLFLIVISTVTDYLCTQMIDQGRVSLTNRIITTTFLLVSAFLFVVIQYDAFEIVRTGLSFSLDVDLQHVLSSTFGGTIFLATVLLAIIANLLYNPLSNLDKNVKRKLFLIISVVLNLGILGFFKYFNFFEETFISLSESLFGVTPQWYTVQIILPVGISFYTFQTMSYTIDVYRKGLTASTSLLDIATYVSFFPQLVAGPIERGMSLLPQFQRQRPSLTWDAWKEGCWLIAWGLFKKLFIADNLATIVNSTFAPFDQLSTDLSAPQDGFRLMVALYAFAFQIYCDFSGYTDIARGTAKLLGFELMINFRLPYFATDPSSFWRRWHISLSTWLRDYLYIPLGGNRGSTAKTYRNLFLTMLLGGLWHGASWTFVIWGAYHGTLLSVYRALGINPEQPGYAYWRKILFIFIFFHLTCIGWLIFRAQNVETIGIFLRSILLSPIFSIEAWQNLKTILFYIWFLIVFQVIQYNFDNLNPMRTWNRFIKLNVWIYIIMSLLVFGSPGGKEFIYFEF